MKTAKGTPFYARALSCLLAVSMLLCAPANASAPSTSDVTSGTFTFAGHDVSGRDLTDSYIYTDKFFDASAYTYNEHLATMSMQLAVGSISSKATEDYKIKSQNLQALLTKLGFTNFETNECYKTQPQENTMGAACAYKTIKASDGQTYTLLAIVPRSAGYEREWAGNFTIGSGTGLHEGFRLAREQLVTFAQSYVKEHGITGSNVKVWSVGYSRGAATANLTGGLLDDDPTVLGSGITLDPKNVYVYTFGTPLGVPMSLNPNAAKYGNIQNTFADYDPITMLAPAGWDFGRYGVDHELPVYDSSTKSRMLGFLANTSSTVYHTYTTNAGSDPDNFKPLKFQLKDSKLSIVYDDANTDASRTSQKGFLNERIRALTKAITKRDEYASDYQPMLAGFMSVYFGMSDEKYADFNSAIGGNKLASITAGLIYASYAAGQYSGHATELQSLLKSLDQQIQSDPAYKDYTDSAKYKTFVDTYLNTTPEKFAAGYDALYAELQELTDAAIKNILTGALDAIETPADSTDRDILKDNNITALRKFVCDMMFSPSETSDTIESVFSIDAPPLKRAATLIGNAGSYMRVHNNEIILSWLRTQDSWYAADGSSGGLPTVSPSPSPSVSPSPSPSPTPVTPAQETKDATDWAVKGSILQGNGSGDYALGEACTRGQLAALLWRAAGSPAPKDGGGFADVPANAYCADAIRWMTQTGIARGLTDTAYGSDEPITRAQAVMFLYRLSGKTVSAGSKFSDVPSDAWYAQAVAWAAGEGITTGTAAGAFSPNDTCTRQQLILFLYRYFNK